MKIAFDIGGVLSKFPFEFCCLIDSLAHAGHEIHIISDMHPVEKIVDTIEANGFEKLINREHIHSADYKTHGEACKAVLCRDLGIQMLVDDFGDTSCGRGPSPRQSACSCSQIHTGPIGTQTG